MATLDPELRMLLVRKGMFDKDPSASRFEVGPDELIRISIVFTGDITALEQAGLQVGSASARVAYGATTLAGLQTLAALPQVEFIHRQRNRHPHLNKSVPDNKADQVWGRSGDNFTGYTGRGVIVGVIDTGIDITHNNFRKPDGTTRILAIWDQTLAAQGGETVPGPITDPNLILGGKGHPLGYGVEYDADGINDTLQNQNPVVKVRHLDEEGHGTHVAGIAAGNGSQAGGCLTKYQYSGVAPEADIIMVRLFGLSEADKSGKVTLPSTSDPAADAIRYILNQANTRHQPAVINNSWGSFSGSMDGTSGFCQDVDALLKANSQGRAIVFSTGNVADKNIHASALVPPGPAASLTLNFTVQDNDTAAGTRTLTVRYLGSNLEAQLTSPVAGTAGLITWVSAGKQSESATANGPHGKVTIDNSTNSITISITSEQIVPNTTPPTYYALVDGTWKLELRDISNTDTNIDAYCVSDSEDHKSPRFVSNISSTSILDDEATGYEALTVGSCKVGGDLSDFSSRGPTLDAKKRTKPELCAPGHNVTSALSSAAPDPNCFICCCGCCHAYVDHGGTSMAAPHVTGVVALMLHKDPNLKHDEITKALTANAAPKPSGTSVDDDFGWGAGRADAQATVNSAAVVAVNQPVAFVAADPSIVPDALAAADPILSVRDELLATERGAEFSQVFEQHAAELRTLINTNRRVATVWHRYRGPVWVRLSLRAVHSPELPVPMQVDDLTLHEAIHRFAHVMSRHASAPLRRDLQAYLPLLSDLAEGMSLSELIQAAGRGCAPAGACELSAPA